MIAESHSLGGSPPRLRSRSPHSLDNYIPVVSHLAWHSVDKTRATPFEESLYIHPHISNTSHFGPVRPWAAVIHHVLSPQVRTHPPRHLTSNPQPTNQIRKLIILSDYLQLAPSIVYTYQRLPAIHHLLHRPHLHNSPTMHLLLCPPPDPLRIILPLV